jgi:NAD(P)H-flavin reductase
MTKSELKVKKVGMIAGGTGVAPMYAILHAMKREVGATTASLLFGNKTADDILIPDLLESLVYKGEIDVTYALDTPPADWSGESGLITK